MPYDLSGCHARRLATVWLLCASIFPCAISAARAQDPKPPFSLDGYERQNGFVPILFNANKASLLVEVPAFGMDMLYQVSLASGIGSNPIGLDRGQPGRTYVVRFERHGRRVLLIERNQGYRALGGSASEQRAVDDSFPVSVLWGFAIESETDGKVLIDATAFLLRDAYGVTQQLRSAQQGTYTADPSRCAFHIPRTKAFPKNTEVETLITVTTDDPPGSFVEKVTPTPSAISMRQHHSFVELPDNQYAPREFDPRVGSNYIQFYDFASPISAPLETRWICRHRLTKKDPGAAISEPVEPVVYYVDPGMPEPIRSAVIEGASWWNQAFEAAGYSNAFAVKVLPEDADPLDIRYNVINWVHRSTRGWAYGSTITDPRTGEILKGVVTLDSQRARHDYQIGSSLAPQHANAACAVESVDFAYLADAVAGTDASELAVARLRQLAAHEVGHAIGLTHNFAASTYGRASVMDYPAPLVQTADGRLDFSRAYARGIGEYDKFAIKYAYAQVGAPERPGLDRIVREGLDSGMLFLSDTEARPSYASDARASLWDNGPDPVAALAREMDVRRIALQTLGLRSLPDRAPVSELERKLLLVYLHHRYQLNATVKMIGGVEYGFGVRDGTKVTPNELPRVVGPERQRAALGVILDTLAPEFLAIPAPLTGLVAPPAYGFGSGTAELFTGRTTPVFDPAAAAEIAADLTLSALLEPNRLARTHGQFLRNPEALSVNDLLAAIESRVMSAPDGERPELLQYRQRARHVYVSRLIALASNTNADPSVRGVALERASTLAESLRRGMANAPDRAQTRLLLRLLEQFLGQPSEPAKPANPAQVPQGDPIGGNS